MSGFDAASLADLKARGIICNEDVQIILQAYTDGRQLGSETAELLISINATASDIHPSWTPCFVDVLSDYLVLQWDPIGYLTLEKSTWITSALSRRTTTTCQSGAKAEIELLIGLLSLSRWSPQTLATFALRRQLSGPVHGGELTGISDNDVEMLRRILYAFGHDDMISVTRLELDLFAEIDQATTGRPVSSAWATLYQKALYDGALSVSGYAATSREQVLSPDPAAQPDAQSRTWMKPYRQLSLEERAIARLERQKVEIVTQESIHALDGQWFSTLLKVPTGSPNLQSIISRLANTAAILDPEIAAIVSQIEAAA
jgi:hypothetical protein